MEARSSASEPSFRFVHASNLELDRNCFAVGDLPPDLRSDLVSAPFLAAERVFDLAIQERVDFVLLAGGLFHSAVPTTWGARFLSLQCERLRGCGIPVYWAEASHNISLHWPTYIPFPSNLYLADAALGQQYFLDTPAGARVLIETVPQADIVGRCSPRRSRTDDPFRIAVVPTQDVPLSIPEQPVDYWAIQGGHRSQTIPAVRGTALTAGSPQGRTPEVLDPGGCLLVTANAGRTISARFIETNRIRWREEILSLDAATDWAAFRRMVHSHIESLTRGSIADIHFVRWNVRGHGPAIEHLARHDVLEVMQEELRHSFGNQRPAVWSLALNLEADVVMTSQWHSLTGDLGEFLRALEDLSPSDLRLPVGLGLPLPQPAAAIAGNPGAHPLAAPHFTSRLKAAARRHGLEILQNSESTHSRSR